MRTAGLEPAGALTEPSVSGWCVYQFRHVRVEKARLDLNQRPPASEAGALVPLSYGPITLHSSAVMPREGLEPPMLRRTLVLQTRCAANRASAASGELANIA